MRKIFILSILVGLFSCETRERPKEILSQEQLSALLVDVYLAEARLGAMPQPVDSTIRYFIPFEEKLLKRHGIPDSVLRKTYAYYIENPKELELVYTSVIDTLTLREQKANITTSHPPVPK